MTASIANGMPSRFMQSNTAATRGSDARAKAMVARLESCKDIREMRTLLEQESRYPELQPEHLTPLYAWFRTHEVDDQETERLMWCALDRLVGKNKEEDESAIRKGIIPRATELLDKAARSSPSEQKLEEREVLKTAVRILGTLSTISTSDKILTSTRTVQVLVDLCKATCAQKHLKTELLEEAITCLALMAPRSRHKRSVIKCDGIPVLVDILKKYASNSRIVVATCKFLVAFAQKQEHTYQIFQHDGIQCLIAAFETGRSGAMAEEVAAAVCGALWSCIVDNVDAQHLIWSSGWLQQLSDSMRPASPCPEAAFGILRRVANPQKDAVTHKASLPDYVQDMVALRFLEDDVLRQGLEFERSTKGPLPGRVKECAGFLGNLAVDQHYRNILKNTIALSGLTSALEVACENGDQDRKVAKIALGALQNFTVCPLICDRLFKTTQICAIVLLSMQIFGHNAQVLEGAIGAVSHLAQDRNCCQRLFDGGVIEALLVFIAEWFDDVMITKRCLVSLRRLMINNVSTVRKVLLMESNRGLHLVIEALSKHIYDEGVATEAVLIIELTELNVNFLQEIALDPCQRAAGHHSDLEPVLERLFGPHVEQLPVLA
eukprot:GEMP01014437.1.p1 GENE.GEMP01014437.1~~GEMP01014437.1.p1  ORF type:complete len:606 (+),score=128.22 GEMP01014437.1:48-1865(+)